MKLADLAGLLKETYTAFSEHKASRLGAALAYYTVFSLAPLMIIVMGVSAFVLGDQAPQRIFEQISSVVGDNAARAISEMVTSQQQQQHGLLATVVGLVTLIIGATGVFAQLQDSLDIIWDVAPRPDLGWKETIRDRIVSFAMVMGIAFLLLVSLVVSAALAGVVKYLSEMLPVPGWTLQGVDVVLNVAVVTVLFALIYKVLPDVNNDWSDVWIGAALTSVLFVVGKFLLGMYLGQASVASAYGAAGSLVVLLLWVYYASQILLFGAQFTAVYANRYGTRVEPLPHAIGLTDEMRAKQGMPSAGFLSRMPAPR